MNASTTIRPTSMHIDALGVALLAGGALGMAGVLVSPQLAEQAWLLSRTMALCGFMVVAGLGLLMRYDWARLAVCGAMVCVIYGQLSQRWMQSDVVQAWLACMHGGTLPELVAPGALPPLSPYGALFSLIICLMLAAQVRLLISARSRGEFRGTASRTLASQMSSRDGRY